MASFDEIRKMPEKEQVAELMDLPVKKRKEIIQKFPPQQRIKLLKLIKEEREKEDLDSADIVKESIEQIARDEIADRIPVPEAEEVDLDRLFRESELEQQLRGESGQIPEGARNIEYGFGPQRRNVEYAIELYNELGEIASSGETGYGTLSRAADLYERIQDIGKYESQSDAMRNLAEGSRRLMKDLFGEYRSKQDYTPGR